MNRLIEFSTTGGDSVLIEASDSTGSVATRGGLHGEMFTRAQQTFEAALGRIQPAVQGVIDELLNLRNRPDEVCVEFGLDLHAEAGAFVAAASSTSNFKVTLTWRRTERRSEPAGTPRISK